MGRIIRGQTLSLRKREFVDADCGTGARGRYVLSRELLPNMIGPILVCVIFVTILAFNPFGGGLRDALAREAINK